VARVKIVPEHAVEFFGCFAHRFSTPFRRIGEAADGDLLSYARSNNDDERS
jgi:hypothetical protein